MLCELCFWAEAWFINNKMSKKVNEKIYQSKMFHLLKDFIFNLNVKSFELQFVGSYVLKARAFVDHGNVRVKGLKCGISKDKKNFPNVKLQSWRYHYACVTFKHKVSLKL